MNSTVPGKHLAHRPLSAWRPSLKQVATVESVASSTLIEGSKLTNQEAEQLLSNLDITRFSSRNEQEIAGYTDVIETIFAVWNSITITENPIKQLHRDLPRYSEKDNRHRGDYKTAHNNVVAFDTDGNQVGVIFETAAPFDTPR